MFPKAEPGKTLRFEGNKINCFPWGQSLSDLLYITQQRLRRMAVVSQHLWVTAHYDVIDFNVFFFFHLI